jgi:hypothetical protein
LGPSRLSLTGVWSLSYGEPGSPTLPWLKANGQSRRPVGLARLSCFLRFHPLLAGIADFDAGVRRSGKGSLRLAIPA